MGMEKPLAGWVLVYFVYSASSIVSLVRKYDHGTFAGATEHVEKRCAKSAPKADLIRYGTGFRELVLMLQMM